MGKVLEVKNIEKYYGNKSNLTKAIDNMSLYDLFVDCIALQRPLSGGNAAINNAGLAGCGEMP